MYTHNWHVTNFDRDESGKVTHIHYALESSIGNTKAFSYGSYKVREKLGVPDSLVDLAFLKVHLLRSLPEEIKQNHLKEIVRRYLYS